MFDNIYTLINTPISYSSKHKIERTHIHTDVVHGKRSNKYFRMLTQLNK